MKLTKDIKIKAYEVIADYKVKVKKSPFIAILKFTNENGGKITSDQLYNDFLQPLSKKACENILERLLNMGYFEKEENISSFTGWLPENEKDFHNQSQEWNYELTALGLNSAEQEEFYEDRKGSLKIFLADNEFIEQKVVKIEEINRQESFEEKDLTSINQTDLSRLQNINKQVELESGTFILENFEEKCRVSQIDEKQMLFESNNDSSSILKIMKFTAIFKETEKQIQNIILKNQFGEYYNQENAILKVKYDPNNLNLLNNFKIEKPQLNNTVFNPITINNIKVSPINTSEAKKWYRALVSQRINKYFLSETEFMEFANKIAQEFELFEPELKNSISREDIIQELDVEKDFYKIAKLETINYLHY